MKKIEDKKVEKSSIVQRAWCLEVEKVRGWEARKFEGLEVEELRI